MAGTAPLKLRAGDGEDLKVIAAVLQDALVPFSDMTFQRRERRFVMVANRFRWEGRDGRLPAAAGGPAEGGDERGGEDARFADGEAGPLYERVNCGVRFGKVAKVRMRGFDPRQRDQILNLLTIDSEPEAITLVFADHAAIRLDVSGIDCHLEDIGEPWPTHWRPFHELDDADAGD